MLAHKNEATALTVARSAHADRDGLVVRAATAIGALPVLQNNIILCDGRVRYERDEGVDSCYVRMRAKIFHPLPHPTTNRDVDCIKRRGERGEGYKLMRGAGRKTGRSSMKCIGNNNLYAPLVNWPEASATRPTRIALNICACMGVL